MFKEGGCYAGVDKGGQRVQGQAVGGHGHNKDCVFAGSISADTAATNEVKTLNSCQF